MNIECFKKIKEELVDLKAELDQIKLLDSYPEVIPKEWQSDIEKLIQLKERLAQITANLSKFKLI